MKNKKFMSVLLAYIFVLTIVPLNFLCQTVKAAELNNENSRPIAYNLMATAMYKDMGILYTSIGAMKVTPAGTELIGKPTNISNAYNLGRINDDLYFSTSLYKDYREVVRELVKINITSGEKTTSAFTIGENTYNYNQYLDPKGFIWFPVQKYGSNASTNSYYILRMDSKNVDSKKQAAVTEDLTYSQIGGSDVYGNVWFLGGRLNYKLIRATYDELKDTVVTKTFSIENQVSFPGSMVVDKENNLWCIDYSNNTIKQLSIVNDSSVQVVKELKLPKNSINIRTDLNKDIWATTQDFSNINGAIYLNKLEGDKFVTKHILNNCNYANIRFANENNILVTSWENGVNQYLLFSNGVEVVDNEKKEKVKHAENLIETAKKSLAFVDYNYAYGAIMELSEKDQPKLLNELSSIWDKVYTPDIAKVLASMKTLINEKDLMNFYNLKNIIDNEVKLERNRLYLLGELDSWGRGIVFTPDVVAATDAIIEAWNKKDAASISKAEAAIAKVKVSGSVKWLNEQLQPLKK